MRLLLVVLGAALGAPARYLLDRAIQARHDQFLPGLTGLVCEPVQCLRVRLESRS